VLYSSLLRNGAFKDKNRAVKEDEAVKMFLEFFVDGEVKKTSAGIEIRNFLYKMNLTGFIEVIVRRPLEVCIECSYT